MNKTGIMPIVQNGKLNLASVESLSRDALRTWIEVRLHGHDWDVPLDVKQGAYPYALFSDIYPRLDRYTRQDIETIVLEFVRDLVRNPSSSWQGNAADELLMLAQSVCRDTLKPYMIEMVEGGRFVTPYEAIVDLHYRALQSLVELNWRGTPEFWHRQLSLCPERFIGIVFDGLTNIAPEHGFALLTDQNLIWNDEVESRILTSFPYLFDTYGVSNIAPLLARYLPRMIPGARKSLREFLVEEGIELPVANNSNRDYRPAKECLRSLGRELQPCDKVAA